MEDEAQKALKERKVLAELLEGLKSKSETIRYPSFQVLLYISEEHPEVLYPEWNFFVDMMGSNNTYWKSSAIRIIANLTRSDTENKFEEIFDRYYNLLNDSVIVAGHITANSGKIARAKPELQSEITKRLLGIDRTTQKHKDLIKAGAIGSFSEYFNEAENKDEIIEFIKAQLDGESPKTKKKAKEFLKRIGK